jgi:hypothetical protein
MTTDDVIAILAILAIFVGLPVAILLVNDRVTAWWRRDRRSPEQKAADAAAYEARLVSPRWDEVCRATDGGRPSAALQALYADRALVTSKGIRLRRPGGSDLDDEWLSTFLPADGSAFADPWGQYLPDRALAFASDAFGDLLFVELTPGGDDRPVQHWYHESAEIEEVAPSLAAFLAWPRADPVDA